MNQSGIILIITLVMLLLFANLVLTQMSFVVLFYKSINQLQLQNSLIFKLETAANRLVNASGPKQSCLISELDPQQVLQKLSTKRVCQFNQDGFQFYYLIENLGLHPCLQIPYQNQLYSTHHLRFSLFIEKPQKMFLQLRVAKPVSLEPCEFSKINYLRPGLQSWRYVEG